MRRRRRRPGVGAGAAAPPARAADALLLPLPRQAPRAEELALRAAYRLPFDLYEELSTGCASRVLVNSAFTASVYGAAFPLLRGVRGMLGDDEPDVLHPAIDPTRNPLLPPTARRDDAPLTLVSINRFERKKNLRLAIEALALARGGGGGGGGGGENLELVLAGGWDARLAANVEYFAELQQAAADLGVADAVRFERNVSDEERGALLAAASAVVYTPSLEHFGIVPLEAMAAGRPVVAVDDGGPKETVKHGATGWLCRRARRLRRRLRVGRREGEKRRAAADGRGGARPRDEELLARRIRREARGPPPRRRAEQAMRSCKISTLA